MKIKSYITEIKYRSFFTCFCFAFNFIFLYYYKEQILFLLGQHQSGNFPHFITTNLPEIFLCLIKLSSYLAIYSTFPVILIQSWLFLVPGLYSYEYKILKRILIISFLIYLITNVLIHTMLLPYCWKFFSGFELNYEESGIHVKLETRLYEYLSFFTELFLLLNLVLNTCLIFSFLLLKFPISSLIKLRKLIYLLSFIVATVLTPPDITSQILVGTTFIFIYESFLISLLLTNEYKRANNGI